MLIGYNTCPDMAGRLHWCPGGYLGCGSTAVKVTFPLCLPEPNGAGEVVSSTRPSVLFCIAIVVVLSMCQESSDGWKKEDDKVFVTILVIPLC